MDVDPTYVKIFALSMTPLKALTFLTAIAMALLPCSGFIFVGALARTMLLGINATIEST